MAEHDVETTGHQWDDEEGFPLQEYNNPLPTWWLYSFYATILWAVVYWVLFPAWPTLNGFSKGVLGWSQYSQLSEEMALAKEAKKSFDDRLMRASFEEIAEDPPLLAYAISGGKAVFSVNCVACHGAGGIGGAPGFPRLVDDDWNFGGTLAQIEESIQNGRAGYMPPHLQEAGGAFSPAQISDLTEYVLQLATRDHDAPMAARGKELFHGDAGCFACHGEHGQGSVNDTMAGMEIDDGIGAVNLTDAIWLYGPTRDAIHRSIARGRTGRMPAWGTGFDGFGKKLDPLAIKQVVLYVHTLGGGQP